MNNSEVKTQVSNILETIRNFGRSDAEFDEIAELLFDELQNADDSDLWDAFFDFFDVLARVQER